MSVGREGRSVGEPSSSGWVGQGRASCSTPICPVARSWPSPRLPGGTLDPSTCPSTRRRCSSRRSCRGRQRSPCLAASRPTTTRSRCGSSRSRSCRPGSRPRRCGATAPSRRGAARGCCVHNAPSLTIEATHDRPVRVKWINELVDADGDFLPHLLPVDPTLHWANPPGGASGRDTRPTFDRDAGARTPARSRWSPTCTAPSGWAMRATATPRPGTCPPRTTSRPATPRRAPGTTSSPARRPPSYGATWGPGFATFQYPNPDRASTKWYHDHTLGMTRLNVYAGPAGFYLIRGGPDGDKAVLDSRDGSVAVLPGPAPQGRRQVPAQQDLLRDPDRDPGPVVQRRRVAVLPRLPGVLRRHRRRLHPVRGVLADLEPGVLRQHDHGQRQHVAVPDRRAAPLPVPVPQRLPVPLPDPGLQPDPGRRGLGDRQRGRLPVGAGEPDRRQRQPAADGAGGARRPDRGLHQRAGGQLRPPQRRTGRAVRRRRTRRTRRGATSMPPTRPRRDRSCSSGSCRPWHRIPPRRRSSCSCRPSRRCRPRSGPGRWR